MRRWIIASLSSVPILATPAAAASVIDGTWKVDLGATQLPKKPDVFLLANGSFTCGSCTPAYTVKADGVLHPVAGHAYYDATGVKVVDAHTVVQKTSKRGKSTFTATNVVSADGKTLHYDFIDTSAPNGVPVTGKGVETRVAAGPAGAHLLSGSWRTTSLTGMSDSGMTISFKTTPDTLTMVTPTAQTYTARFGGPAVPIKGDTAETMAAVTRAGAHGFVETDTRKGKVVSVLTVTVAPDGKTMTVLVKDLLQGTSTTFKALKQ
jgi:hypothetical protein